MKKDNKKSNLIIFILIGIIVILLISCTLLFIKNEYLDFKTDYVPYNNNYITRDEAIDIALRDIKVDRNMVYDLEVELEKKYNEVVYEVNFDYNYLDYEYYIKAEDGSILKAFAERD